MIILLDCIFLNLDLKHLKKDVIYENSAKYTLYDKSKVDQVTNQIQLINQSMDTVSNYI